MSVFAPLKNIAKIINFRGLQAFFLKNFNLPSNIHFRANETHTHLCHYQ